MIIFDGPPTRAPHIIQYNAETDLVGIRTPRRSASGVDLSTLAVGITTNLKGEDQPDRIMQTVADDRITVGVQDDNLLVKWKIGLNTTINPGCIRFMADFKDDAGAVVWHSREYYLQIDPALTAESLVVQYPSMFDQYETLMRKMSGDAQAAIIQAEEKAEEAKTHAGQAKADADRAETAREEAATARTAVKTMQQAVATDRAAVEATQKDVETRQTQINTAHKDIKTKTTAVLQAAEQVGSDKQAVDRAVTAFDETVTNAVETIDDKAAAARRDLDGAVSSATGEINSAVAAAEARINKTAADCAESMAQQAQDVADSVDAAKTDVAATASNAKADISDTASSAKTDIAAMVSTAQGAATSAAQSAAQAAQSAQEAQAAADSIGGAISPALLTTTAAGTGAVTMGSTADYPLQALAITGQTQQDGVPEPANPVYPVSLGNSGTIGVKVCGRNLLDWEGAADYSNWHTTAMDADHPFGGYPYLIVQGFVVGETYTVAVDSIPELGATDLYCIFGDYPGANKGQANWLYHKTADALCRPVRTFVATASVYYLNCSGCRSDTVSQIVRQWLPNMRVYLGSYTAETIPPYRPYNGQTVTIPVERPIMRIGSAADRVDFTTGKVVREIQEISVDESAAWYDFKTYDTGYCRVAVEMPLLKGSNGFTGALCSHLPEGGRGAIVNNPPAADGFALIPSGDHGRLYIALDQSNLSDVSLDGFKAWLSSHPMKIWAEAVTPTQEQIESSTLRSYDGTTTISVYGTPGEPSPEIEATAVLDATTVVADQQAQIDDLREMINNLQAAALAAEIGGTQ